MKNINVILVYFNPINIAEYFVDFYIPEKNTIIEVEGPAHFIAPSRDRNITTRARYRILERKGYKIIKVPFFINEYSGE